MARKKKVKEPLPYVTAGFIFTGEHVLEGLLRWIVEHEQEYRAAWAGRDELPDEEYFIVTKH